MGAPLSVIAAACTQAISLVPTPAPALDLSFTTDAVDARVVTSRPGTGASRVSSAGLVVKVTAPNTPRVDFDPVTLAAKGLITEELRINLCLQCTAIATAPWTLSAATVTTPGQAAPDGTAAQLLKESATTAVHGTSQSVTFAAATLYQLSIYAHAGPGRSQFQLTVDSGGTAFGTPQTAVFDLAAGTATVTSGAGVAKAPVPAGGGWYRCVLTATSTAGGAAAVAAQLLNAGAASYLGDGASGLYLWGCQVEAGVQESSLIFTTTASVTRGAERSAITGANFSAFFDPSGVLVGTLAVDGSWVTLANAGNTILAQLDDGTTANRINVTIGNAFGYVLSAGLTVGGVSASASGQYPGGMVASGKLASAFSAATGVRTIANGLPIQNVNGPQVMPPVTALGIGNQSFSATSKGATWVRRIRYWTQMLSDDRVSALTV